MSKADWKRCVVVLGFEGGGEEVGRSARHKRAIRVKGWTLRKPELAWAGIREPWRRRTKG